MVLNLLVEQRGMDFEKQQRRLERMKFSVFVSPPEVAASLEARHAADVFV